MTRVDEFDAFYHESRRQVLHQTYALTGDLAAATLAVQDAYANAWQHWPKLRLSDPLSQVRPEAMRLATLRRGAHLLRRKRREDTDTELLEALGSLSSTARRLVLLQTAGGLDITTAAREVNTTPEDAMTATDQAVTDLEDALGASTGELEERLDNLRRITDAASLPRASIIRRSGARRKLRNTVVAVATSAAVIAAAGYVVTAPAGGRTDGLHPDREQVGSEASDERERKIGADEDQLLRPPHIAHLELDTQWNVTRTMSDPDALKPLSSCALARYGSTQLRQVWVRSFKAATKKQQTAVEAVEVARTRDAARNSYRRQLNWYARCQVPRMQLLEAYSADRKGSDIRILVLRKWSAPIRTITVGVARSGFTVSTFIHQVEGPRGPELSAFADILDDSLGLLCPTNGGVCQIADEVRPVAPPLTGEGRGFLGSVDLPPVAHLAKVWGVTPIPARPDNPSSTECDKANFRGDGISGVRAHLYIVVGAKRLPGTFGVSETIATFPSEGRARNYLKRLERRMRKCEDRNLGATVRGPRRDRQAGIKVRTWWLELEAGERKAQEFRLALVRNGPRVAQVMFTPVGKYDISGQDFNSLAIRAGQRLAELE